MECGNKRATPGRGLELQLWDSLLGGAISFHRLTGRHEGSHIVAGEQSGKAIQLAAPPLRLIPTQHADDVVLLKRQLVVILCFVRIESDDLVCRGRKH